MKIELSENQVKTLVAMLRGGVARAKKNNCPNVAGFRQNLADELQRQYEATSGRMKPLSEDYDGKIMESARVSCEEILRFCGPDYPDCPEEIE